MGLIRHARERVGVGMGQEGYARDGSCDRSLGAGCRRRPRGSRRGLALFARERSVGVSWHRQSRFSEREYRLPGCAPLSSAAQFRRAGNVAPPPASGGWGARSAGPSSRVFVGWGFLARRWRAGKPERAYLVVPFPLGYTRGMADASSELAQIQGLIYEIRGQKVMLDRELAALYVNTQW